MKLDHVVQLVEDLGKATADWQSVGFTVSPGGVHADGLTHNALVIFRDGSYVELIAFRSADAASHRWARYRGFWGPIDFAISVSDISSVVPRLKSSHLPYSSPSNGGRTRPDGVELKWHSMFATDQTLGLPFFIEDVTERSLRVPMRDENVQHDNGAAGITQVHVAVPSLDAVADKFETVFGASNTSGTALLFNLQDSTLSVSQPAADSAEAQFIARRGAGPIAVTIAAPLPIVIRSSGLS